MQFNKRDIYEQGLIAVPGQLHDELDSAVLDAYGWSDLAPALVSKPGCTAPYPDNPIAQAEAEESLLQRLADLNGVRAREEARGLFRWLRPEFQNPAGDMPQQGEAGIVAPENIIMSSKGKPAWPRTLAEQVQAVREVLVAQPAPITSEQVARHFKRAQTKRVTDLLDTLEAL